MAISATAQWEIRANGAATNGGFYTEGGTDYSQQDAAQLTVTDGVGTGTTALTSATGGFTAAMIGNGVYVDADAAWYEITAVPDGNTLTVDRATGTFTGATVNVGGAVTFIDAVMEAAEPGNTYWLANDGTHVMGADVLISSGSAGTAALSITLNGYNASRGDNPTGSNRPLIAAGGFRILFANYWRANHFRQTSTSTAGVVFSTSNSCRNVFVVSTAASADRGAFQGSGTLIGCEAVSTNGYGLLLNTGSIIIGCVFRDSKAGIYMNGSTFVFNSIIHDCITGMQGTNQDVHMILNVIINNCTTGIAGTSAGLLRVMNSIFSNCTTGATADAGYGGETWYDYNNWFNNGTDVVNVTKGAHAMALDPEFTDAANGDFSIGTNLKARAFPGAFGDGINTGYLDVGAVQRQELGGGSGKHALIG